MITEMKSKENLIEELSNLIKSFGDIGYVLTSFILPKDLDPQNEYTITIQTHTDATKLHMLIIARELFPFILNGKDEKGIDDFFECFKKDMIDYVNSIN